MLDAPQTIPETTDDGALFDTSTRLLQAFFDIDPGMSLNAALALLLIRQASIREKPITTQDLSQELKMHPSTMSRMIDYLGSGKPSDNFPGLGLIRIDIDQTDRRRRLVTFTHKGWHSLRQLVRQARSQEEA
ncbi:MAG: hypothetical protein ACT4OK_10940 [Gemmobacter sp.]